MDGNILVWLLAVPLLTALGAFVSRSRAMAEAVHLAGSTVLLGLSLALGGQVLAGGSLAALEDLLHADALSAVLVLIIGTVGFLAGLYSVGYLRHDLAAGETDEKGLRSYYGFYHLLLFTTVLAALSNNIAILWAAVEGTTLASAFLVGFYRRKTAQEAAWKYVLVCGVGLAFALFGTVLTYADAFHVLQHAHRAMAWTEVVQVADRLDPQLARLAFVFILIGYGTKLGLVPMHTWLPDAYGEAPSPATALLSGVVKKGALFALIRYYPIAARAAGGGFPQTLFLVFGLLSVAVAAFFILRQKDLKRQLAYSSVEHVGIIATALGTGVPLGILAGLFHAVNHSVSKSLAFCAVGNVEMKYRTRETGRIQGMLRAAPLTALTFLAGLLAMVGSPPTGLFASELMTLTAAFQRGLLWPAILLLALLVMVFVAFFLVISETLFGPAPEGMARSEPGPVALTLVPLAVLVLFLVVLGLQIPAPLFRLLEGAVAVVTGGA
ncbi:MAG: hydrogenase 4 subunit F [Bacillota bacterium]